MPPGLTPPPTPHASAKPTGIGAWLAPEGNVRRLNLEFRIHVRQGGLTVTVLDTDARVPLLPSVALTWQAYAPTQDRNALRVLSRFESGNPRHPAVDIRDEDAAELLPLLRELRVLLEPALMQLRFADEPLKPRFDLEMVGADTIVAKVTFERPGDGRRFQLTSGGWFQGAPGWHIDTSEGIARPIDHHVAPSALGRLLRSPTIAEPASELIGMITSGLPKVALEVGAELPELSQVADVIDLEPTFRMRASGGITDAQVASACRLRRRRSGGTRRRHLAARPDSTARRGTEARQLHPLRHRGTAAGRPGAARARPVAGRERRVLRGRGRTGDQVLVRRGRFAARGLGPLRSRAPARDPRPQQAAGDERTRLERRGLAQRQAGVRVRRRRRRPRRARALPQRGPQVRAAVGQLLRAAGRRTRSRLPSTAKSSCSPRRARTASSRSRRPVACRSSSSKPTNRQ